MPVVLRIGALRFFFFSNEGDPREPIHIHVRRGSDQAEFWLSPVALVDSYGFDARELGEIARLVVQYETRLVETWHEYFG